MVKGISVLAIVVTYNPEIEVLLRNVKTLLDDGSVVFISDNGSQNADLLQTTFSAPYYNERVILKRNESNIGLAAAQNSGLHFAVDKGMDFVNFFDQDTLIPSGFTEDMVKEYRKLVETSSDAIGMLAPNFYDFRLNEYTHFARLTKTGYTDVSVIPGSANFISVSFVVSSGSMMPVDVVKKIGFLKETYFIDQVDTEYALRVQRFGFKIFVTPRVTMSHTIGHRDKKQLLWLTIKPNYHSAVRKYFIFRNGVKTVHEYKTDFPGIRVLMFKRFVHDFLGVVFFEKNKIKKVIAMAEGIRDGRQDASKWQNNR